MAKNLSLHRSRRALIAGSAAGLAATAAPALAQGKDPVKVGELNSYSRMAAFTRALPQRMQLALEEINAKGGVLGGRRLEFISRDDGAHDRRCDAGRGGARHPRERVVARRHVPLQHRPGGRGLRQPGKVLLPRLRAADGRRHHGAGQPLHLPGPALDLHADQDAGRAAKGKAVEALGDRRAELRIRPVRRGELQAPDQGGEPEGRDRRRAVPGARQARRRRDRQRRSTQAQARRHLQRALRRRPDAVRARGQHAAACSRAGPSRASSPASPNSSCRSARRRRRAGSSPATRGTRSPSRSTRPSSTPTGRSSTTRRGSARSSATSIVHMTKRPDREGRLDRHREADRDARGHEASTPSSARSRCAASTTSRRRAPGSARRR